MKYFLILPVVLLLYMIGFTQDNFHYECGTSDIPEITSSFPGPLFKPMKTLPLTDTAAYLKVLMVFIEFKDDTLFDPNSVYWAPKQAPRWKDSIFAPVKVLNSLGGYPNQIISDFYNTVVRDSFDVIGDTYHIILPHTYSYYQNTFGDDSGGRNEANRDALRMLDTSLSVDWGKYDRWRWNGSAFVREQDDYIDMVYMLYRRGKPDFFNLSSGGHASLMIDYNTLLGGKYLRQFCSLCDGHLASGLYGINGSSFSKKVALDYFVHEYGHYTLGDHRPYSRIYGGTGETDLGWERTFTPQDEITLGIANTITVNFSNPTYYLDDFVTTGKILKVPISGSDYFLVCNRRRLTMFDSNMGGDTNRSEFFGPAGNYDKGVYIYHVYDGDEYNSWVDLESADGLWDWEYTGLDSPDWDPNAYLPIIKKLKPGRLNDEPGLSIFDTTRFKSRDEMSVSCVSCGDYTGFTKWLGEGKKHTYTGDPGLERSFTNLQENWTSRATLGTRYDAWKVGYNQVFSHWSSPNTTARGTGSGSDSTGIMIYYESLSSNTATIQVYKKGQGGYTEADILNATPPSRPMLYKIQVVDCNGTVGHPMITWDNNMEPDMVRTSRDLQFKRYKIYRALSTSLTEVPTSYTYLATYDDFTPDDTANFKDNSNTVGFSISCGSSMLDDGYARYVVTAIDNTNWESVKSDWVSTSGFDNTHQSPLQNVNINPIKFNIYNYPNPFNPSTSIKYSVPVPCFVKIRIYNLLGKEIMTLVNEVKGRGYYSAEFDGTNLPSGVYFYKIEAGSFVVSKKMVLVK